MEWSLVIFLIAGMVSLVLLMGIIIFGVKKSSEYKELHKLFGEKDKDLNSTVNKLQKALESSEAEKTQILERLKNLEAIVTSEAWDSIQSGEDAETTRLHIEEEEKEELNDSDKAAKIAKRVR